VQSSPRGRLCQALCFAALFPHRVARCVALCSTARTSATTQALRAVQRALVESDPCWQRGEYADSHGPALGLGLARAMGTIFYRSREEFDARFAGRPR
jgi:homoserine O-acetyltransferase